MAAARDLVELLTLGVKAVDPSVAVQRVVQHDAGDVVVGEHRIAVGDHLQVMALGKAAPAMVRGLAAALPELTLYGIEVALTGASEARGVVTMHGSHPVPDLRSHVAGRRLLAAAALTPVEVATIVLISGGGSALAEVPAAGVSLADIAEVTDRLLVAGADIEEINTVRRHLSALKGGGLGAALRGPCVTVAVSDVVGAAPHAIASGPTVPDPTGPEDMARIVRRYGVPVPPPAAELRVRPEGLFVVAADGRVAADAVVTGIREAGLRVTIVDFAMHGDAADAARSALARTEPGTVGVFAGETTVEVVGDGVGGRNQHAALVAAVAIEDTPVRFAAMGTDGIDGPTLSAGAVVDGATCAALRACGVDPHAAIAAHDSHTALAAVGATLDTGPTGTNVGDLWIVDRSGTG